MGKKRKDKKKITKICILNNIEIIEHKSLIEKENRICECCENKDELENNLQNKEKEKDSKIWDVLFDLNLLLFPFAINKKFKVNKNIYESLLVIFISIALMIIGAIVWGISVVSFFLWLFKIHGLYKKIIAIVIILWMFLIASVLVISGKEFIKETDSNKIYSFSSIIIALISFIFAIITFLWKTNR